MVAAQTSQRPTKRARTVSKPATATTREGLFAPFRSLGHVTTGVPFVVQSRSSKYLETPAMTVVTSLGNCWAMWEGASLRLLFVGPDMGSPITSLALSFDSVFAASAAFIGRYVRGKEVGRFVLAAGKSADDETSSSGSSSSSSSEGSDSDSDSEDSDMEEDGQSVSRGFRNLTLFGNTLVALSSDGSKLYVWDIPTLVNPASKDPSTSATSPTASSITPYATIDLSPGFTATTLVHPASYLNKIVVGSAAGALAIYNVRTASLIHTFEPKDISSTPSRITALTQSPAIDVLGVGTADGQCILFDVRLGEVLGKVRLEGEGCGEVAGVSFRNDDISQTLAVSSTTGHIALFDLSAKLRLLHLVRAAHEGPVGGLEWLQGQPLMMTSGADNSLKQWLFDSPTAAPRLLKQRSGHHAPPHLVRFYGDDGKSLLTAGADHALRFTSVVRDSRGYELSQGSITKKANHLGVRPSTLKLPLIKALSYSTSRSKDWDDVVTMSSGEEVGRTWSVQGKRVGKWTLPGRASITATAVSACGNFGLVGSSQGDAIMYNMQSGLLRKSFKIPTTHAIDARSSQVTSVSTDALNRLVIVSTLKGGIYFFDFQSMQLNSFVALPAGVTAGLLQRDSGLLAFICDDLTVRVVDIETLRVVRELSGFRGTILDLTFSPDSRWIITTSQDSIVRTFDLPTGQLVDAFRTATIATSITFSPTSDFLATSHVDSLGVYLWANRAQFSEVSLRTFVEDDLADVALPTMQGVDIHSGLSELTAPVRWEDAQPYTTPEQLSDELLTLSLMPRSRWQTLLNLETIKQRNKPKEAPKAPERAPFFLPTLPGVKQRFDFGTPESTPASEAPKTHKLHLASTSIETDFVVRLNKEESSGDYQAFFEYLKGLSPSATDLEFRSMSTLPHLNAFLAALSARLASHKDFEAVQTYLAYFLRIHGDVLVQNVELKVALERVAAEQKREAGRLMDLTHYALGTLAFLRSTPIA